MYLYEGRKIPYLSNHLLCIFTCPLMVCHNNINDISSTTTRLYTLSTDKVRVLNILRRTSATWELNEVSCSSLISCLPNKSSPFNRVCLPHHNSCTDSILSHTPLTSESDQLKTLHLTQFSTLTSLFRPGVKRSYNKVGICLIFGNLSKVSISHTSLSKENRWDKIWTKRKYLHTR